MSYKTYDNTIINNEHFDSSQRNNEHFDSSPSAYMNEYIDGFNNLHILAIDKSSNVGRDNTKSKEWDVILKTPYLNGRGSVCMKIDTQAQCNVISYNIFKNLENHGKIKLAKTTSQITAFGNNIVKPVGKISFHVLHNDVLDTIECEVVDGNVQNLLVSKDSLRLGLVKRVNAYETCKRRGKTTRKYVA